MKDIKGIILGIVLWGVGLLILISILSFWNVKVADWQSVFSVENIVGPIGAYIGGTFIFLFGIASIGIPLLLLLYGINLARRKDISIKKLIATLFFLLLLTILFAPLSNPSQEFRLVGGGWVGFKLGIILLSLLNITGSYIVVTVLFCISLIYITDGNILRPFKWLGNIGVIFLGIFKKERERQRLSKPKIVLAQDRDKPKKEREPEKIEEREEYQLPPLSLLAEPMPIPEKEAKEDLLTLSAQLEETLSHFNIEAKVVCVNRGPVVTSFEVQPAPGVRVSSISGLSNDIALSLAAKAVRIEAPIPGKQALGIEIPNKKPQTVSLKEGLSASDWKRVRSKLFFFLGKDVSGENIFVDLSDMPHLLVAGVTGSGKSVCLASLIVSLLYRAKPEELKLMLIDPKRVELTAFSEIPHLITPVITDAKKAVISLQWLIREMEDRYKLFAASGVRDIAGYQKREQMPYIVVVIDELADLMAVSTQACEEALTRLSQMARAVGIHLVISTQRPSVDVITGVIKANFSSRIAFQVFSKVDSRTILDIIGAEKLLGKGDMLFLPAGAPKPKRLQGAFISLPEIEKVVDFIKEQQIEIPSYKIEFESMKEKVEEREEEEFSDEMYEKALTVVGIAGYASTSMIQRKLKIGYNRAARIIEKMEEEGIVGPPDGSKPREVLVDLDRLRR
jgi:S-DNA-T family DNA segregation ATPase FtsK/SpoIIIE